MSKPRLGKGLQALIAEMSPEEAGVEVQQVQLNQVSPNPYQPRREFSEESLQELADSIREHGVIQPVTVRRRGGAFELVAGERRWRAARMAGLHEIPALVRDFSDQELMELSIIENLQREDLNPVDEARGYRQLMEQLDYTQERLAERIGKSRPHVANSLRLLTLPADILEHVSRGTISPGHARAILSVPEGARRGLLARVLSGRCSVREAEHLAKSLQAGVSRETKRAETGKEPLDAAWKDIEMRLQQRLQTRVRVHRKGQRGSIEIMYHSHEELERLLDELRVRE